MARYRKIDPRIWNDAKFRALPDDGKLAFLFLLTHPHMTALGAMRATIPGLAAELEWETERFREAFVEAFRKGLVKHDAKAAFVWLPKFLKYNGPESPNVVRAWAGALDLLPECALKAECIQSAKAFADTLKEAFAEAFREAFAKGMPYPEPEPEPEQEQEWGGEPAAVAAAPPADAPKPKRGSKRCPPDFVVDAELAAWAKANAPLVNVERATMMFRNHTFASARTDWPATWQNWLLKDQQEAERKAGPRAVQPQRPAFREFPA